MITSRVSRRLRVDATIAATAIVSRARLATGNANAFQPFVEHGLVLAPAAG